MGRKSTMSSVHLIASQDGDWRASLHKMGDLNYHLQRLSNPSCFVSRTESLLHLMSGIT